MALRQDRLQRGDKITDGDGIISLFFQSLWQRVMEIIERADTTQQEQIDAIAAAQAAADSANAAAAIATAAATTANDAADASAAESSIISSFVKGFVGTSPLEADNAGNVTISAHTRQYGNTTLNPDVALLGGVLATGQAAGTIVRIYYDDATRADTTPVFAFTADPAVPPVQGGDRHVIGAIEIPAAGTVEGGYVQPPGYTGIIP